MPNPQQLITENLNIWTAAIKKRGSQGRGSSKKIELHGIKKLRELILELAVRGLLVPQNPNDEPASVLLEKIASEKEQLLKDGKIKKQKALPEIGEDEKAFELPKGWEWGRFDHIGSTNIGLTYKPTNVTESGIPVLRSSNVQKNKICLVDLVRVSGLEPKEGAYVAEGDLLICARNGSKALVGKSALITGLNEPMVFGAFMAIFRCRINPYLHMFLSSPLFRRKLEGVSTTTINQITQSNLRSTLAPIPPEAEQPRIVAKVDELMALCDQLEQQTENSLTAHQTLVETLLKSLLDAAQTTPGHASSTKPIQQNQNENQKDKTKGDPFQQAWKMIWENFDALFTTEHSIDQLKQTILQLAVMGKLVPQNENDEPASVLLEKIAAEKEQLIKDKKIKKQKPLPEISEDEKPFELPKGWEWVRLDDVCYGITSGSTPPKSEFLESKGVPYLKVYNIKEQEIAFDYKPQYVRNEYHSTKLKRSILYPGDVVMNIVGPPLGKVAIIPADYPEWNCNQAITFFRPIIHEFNRYIYTYLKAGVFLNAIELIGTAGQDNISVTKSRSVCLPTPPLNEQPRIVAKVDELMTLCDTLKERIRESQVTQLHLADAMAEQALKE